VAALGPHQSSNSAPSLRVRCDRSWAKLGGGYECSQRGLRPPLNSAGVSMVHTLFNRTAKRRSFNDMAPHLHGKNKKGLNNALIIMHPAVGEAPATLFGGGGGRGLRATYPISGCSADWLLFLLAWMPCKKIVRPFSKAKFSILDVPKYFPTISFGMAKE